MSQLNFGIRIGTQNETASGLRSSLASIQSFARTAIKPITIPFKLGSAGLGFLRDIQVGLRPLVDQLDTVIDRGGSLDSALKSLATTWRSSSAQAGVLGQSIQQASHGTLSLLRSVELLNRAGAQGLGFREVADAVDFASRKAAAIGENAGGLIDAVLADLGKGTSRALDDLGITATSERIKKEFDAIRGEGAFAKLAPRQQILQVAQSAIGEMRSQLKDIGITGNEIGFQWSRIKTEVTDASDRLFRVVAGSKAMSEAAKSTADFLRGVSEHFEGGGSFGELLTGKGQSGGLLGVLKGAATDLAVTLGDAIAAGILKGLSAAISGVQAAISKPSSAFGGGAFFGSVNDWAGRLFGSGNAPAVSINSGATPLDRAGIEIEAARSSRPLADAAIGGGATLAGIYAGPSGWLRRMAFGSVPEMAAGAGRLAMRGLGFVGLADIGASAALWGSGAINDYRNDAANAEAVELARKYRIAAENNQYIDRLIAARRGSGGGIGFFGGMPINLAPAFFAAAAGGPFDGMGGILGPASAGLDRASRSLMAGMGFSRTGSAWSAFTREFAPGKGIPNAASIVNAADLERFRATLPPASEFGLRLQGRQFGDNQRRILNLENLTGGEGLEIRTAAAAAAKERIRLLGSQHARLSPADRAGILQEEIERARNPILGPLRSQQDALKRELDARVVTMEAPYQARPGVNWSAADHSPRGGQANEGASAASLVQELSVLVKKIDQAIGVMRSVTAALGVADTALADTSS